MGRSRDNSIILHDRTVGNHHLRLVCLQGLLYIEDLGSKNHTRVSGGPVLSEGQKYPLIPHLRFRAGRARISVSLEEEETPRSRSAPTVSLVRPEPPSGDRPGPAMAQSPSMEPEPARQPAPDPHLTFASRSLPDPPPKARVLAAEEFNPSTEFDGSLESSSISHSSLLAEERIESPLTHHQVRLVVVTPVMRRVVPVMRLPFSIGSDPSVDLPINNRSVALRHATIHFKDGAFIIQNRSVSGMVQVDDKPLSNGLVRQLSSPTSIRLGHVELLFLCERPAEREANRRRQEKAGMLLINDSSLTADEVQKASQIAQTENRDLAEVLLLRGRLSPRRWVQALKQVRQNKVRRSRRIKLLGAVVAVGFVVAFVSLVLRYSSL